MRHVKRQVLKSILSETIPDELRFCLDLVLTIRLLLSPLSHGRVTAVPSGGAEHSTFSADNPSTALLLRGDEPGPGDHLHLLFLLEDVEDSSANRALAVQHA